MLQHLGEDFLLVLIGAVGGGALVYFALPRIVAKASADIRAALARIEGKLGQ